jgi:pantothenate kinase-related protein Tda10
MKRHLNHTIGGVRVAEHFTKNVEPLGYKAFLVGVDRPACAKYKKAQDKYLHQITGVYEAMLPKQPLRFVLADDPGAGKTIMAGLYIRELIMRADAAHIGRRARKSCESIFLPNNDREQILSKTVNKLAQFISRKNKNAPAGVTL